MKKVFTLLTLLLTLGGANSVWATDIFSATVTRTTAQSVASGGDYTVLSTDADMVGGSIVLHNGKASAANLIHASSCFDLGGSGSSYIHITLNTGRALQNGDVLTFTYNGTNTNLKISSTTSSGSDKTLTAGAYTVTESDGLKGATDIYIFKGSNTAISQINSITITGTGLLSDLALTSSAEVTIAPTATSQIEYTSSSTGAMTYTSSNPSVATVSETGLITGVAVGFTTIKVSQAADASYRAAGVTVTVNVQKTTSHTGEWVLDTENGERSSNTYTTTDGSLVLTGALDGGSNTSNDLKNSHFKHSGDITITLPSNYSVNTLWFVGYSNGNSDQTATLKSVDGTAVTPQSGTILKKDQTPATDCVGFELAAAATKSIVVNISNQCRGYFILNPAAQNITMTQVGSNYYASYYSAGEVTITGATAYTAELDAVNNKLVLTECAGGVVGGRTGVILIGNSASATATPSFTGASKKQGDLIGAGQKAVSSTANKTFVLGVVGGVAGFYKYTGSTLAVNKAYLYSNDLAATARSIDFVFDDETTAINGVSTDKVKTELKKFFENGKLVIENNGVKYNAAGQQVK